MEETNYAKSDFEISLCLTLGDFTRERETLRAYRVKTMWQISFLGVEYLQLEVDLEISLRNFTSLAIFAS